MLPLAGKRGQDSEAGAGNAMAVVKGEFVTSIEQATLSGERRSDELTGVVIVMSTFPGQTEHLVDADVLHALAKTLERDVEMIDEHPVGDRDFGSNERNAIGADAERGEDGEALEVADAGLHAVSAISEEHAEHLFALSKFELDARCRRDFIVLMSEQKEDHGV